MRAIQITEFGGPEVLNLAQLPNPVAGEGEVLVRVSRAGINFADTHARQDEYVAKYELPLIPGVEVAGVREDTGERVVAICGTGGYAEYVCVPTERCIPIPEGVDDDTALALLIQGLTAWHLFKTVGHVMAGESVVIGAAAGGVGSLCCQLGSEMGAGRVIALASTDAKRALALELGADVAIDSAPEGLKDRILEANGGKPVDVVFEMAGGQSFDECLHSLAPLGRLCVCGIASREKNRVSNSQLLKMSWSVCGFWLFHLLERPELITSAMADLFARAERGEVKAVVGGVFPLAEAADAQVALSERRTTGKLLLDPTV
ncbi:MAG: NADPH:quinone oxidoreductase family protein [Actinomycetes bacterium]